MGYDPKHNSWCEFIGMQSMMEMAELIPTPQKKNQTNKMPPSTELEQLASF
jgi:hypothetical protein